MLMIASHMLAAREGVSRADDHPASGRHRQLYTAKAHRSARPRGGLVSQTTTAYLTDKCEVRNRDVTGGKAVFARESIEPGEVVGVWSGRLFAAAELDDLSQAVKLNTVQVEEGLYLASLTAHEPPDYINHSCDPNSGLSGQITIIAMHAIESGEE